MLDNKLRDIQVRQGRIIQALRFLSREVTNNSIKDHKILSSKIREGIRLAEDFQGIRDEIVAMGYKSHPKAQYLFIEFWTELMHDDSHNEDDSYDPKTSTNKYQICLSWTENKNTSSVDIMTTLFNYLKEFNAELTLSDYYAIGDGSEYRYKYEINVTDEAYHILKKSLNVIANEVIRDRIDYGIYWKKI